MNSVNKLNSYRCSGSTGPRVYDSGTICCRTSINQTCLTAASYSRWL